jgi:hypothetical protein
LPETRKCISRCETPAGSHTLEAYHFDPLRLLPPPMSSRVSNRRCRQIEPRKPSMKPRSHWQPPGGGACPEEAVQMMLPTNARGKNIGG